MGKDFRGVRDLAFSHIVGKFKLQPEVCVATEKARLDATGVE